jgi:uncharacterized membrane protein
VLSTESIEIAKNPNAQLSCSVNIVINCATVARHPSASLLGFPNSFLGMVAEPVVITIAIAGLAGVLFPRRFMFAAQVFYTAGFIFAYYLFFVSTFVIQALCPWCLLVTLSTTFVFFSMTRYNIRENNLYLSTRVLKIAKNIIAKDYDKFGLAILVVGVIATIIIKYGSALFS